MATWVRFTADYNYRPKPSITVAYKAGMVMPVPRDCATLAVAKGKAERVTRDGQAIEMPETLETEAGDASRDTTVSVELPEEG